MQTDSLEDMTKMLDESISNEKKQELIKAIGSFGHPDSLAPLKSLYPNQNSSIQNEILRAINHIPNELDKDFLIDIFNNEENYQLRKKALKALHKSHFKKM